MDTMKALIFHGVGRASVETVPIPKPGATEVLVRIRSCGICGTDPHMLHGVAPARFPLIPGHECAGDVVEAGEAVRTLKPGDRVTLNPAIHCGFCENCQRGLVNLCKYESSLSPIMGVYRDGAFAEYAVMDQTHAMRLPDAMSYDEGAMVEPLACCLRGAYLGGCKVGDTVLIHGAGAIGNMNMQLCRLRGATKVIVSDPIPKRREAALENGADVVLDPSRGDVYAAARELAPNGIDVIVECAGKTSLVESSVMNVRRGGTVIVFGICPPDEYARISPNYLNDNEITLRGSYNNPYTHYDSMQAIAAGRVRTKNLITHHFSLDEYEAAFSLFGKPEAIKIMIHP